MLKSLVVASVATLMVPSMVPPKAYLAQSPERAFASPADDPADDSAGKGPAARGTVIERAGDGLFYVEGKVNGAPVRFVVDSGASVVILNAADAARAGVTGRDGVSVDTAGGSAMMKRTRLQKLALAGQDLANVDAVVMQKDLEVSLLGQSALAQMGPITFRGDRLELR